MLDASKGLCFGQHGVGCIFRVLDGVLDAFTGLCFGQHRVGCTFRVLDGMFGAFFRVLDAFLGCWMGCWMLFKGVGCIYRVVF